MAASWPDATSTATRHGANLIGSSQGPRTNLAHLLHPPAGARARHVSGHACPEMTTRGARRGVGSSDRLGRHRWKAGRSIALLAGCRRLRIHGDRDSERFFASAMLVGLEFGVQAADARQQLAGDAGTVVVDHGGWLQPGQQPGGGVRSTRRRWWSRGWWLGWIAAAVIEVLWGSMPMVIIDAFRHGGQVRDGQPDFRRGMPLLSHVTAGAGRVGRLPMSQPGGGKESASHAAGTLARYGLQTQRPARQSEQVRNPDGSPGRGV
jgi:hypothetical protein